MNCGLHGPAVVRSFGPAMRSYPSGAVNPEGVEVFFAGRRVFAMAELVASLHAEGKFAAACCCMMVF